MIIARINVMLMDVITYQAPFVNCLIQNGDLGGEVELINLPLIFVVYCSNYNGAPVKMVSLSTVPPPPVESETLHGRLEKGAWYVPEGKISLWFCLLPLP